MICMVKTCGAELWRQKRAETDAAALVSGWRFAWDLKAPLLSTGVALCPKCVVAGEEKNFEPAKGKSK